MEGGCLSEAKLRVTRGARKLRMVGESGRDGSIKVQITTETRTRIQASDSDEVIAS